MSMCAAAEPTHSAHCCVGDAGHGGSHWCLLGHTWTDSDSNPEEAA